MRRSENPAFIETPSFDQENTSLEELVPSDHLVDLLEEQQRVKSSFAGFEEADVDGDIIDEALDNLHFCGDESDVSDMKHSVRTFLLFTEYVAEITWCER